METPSQVRSGPGPASEEAKVTAGGVYISDAAITSSSANGVYFWLGHPCVARDVDRWPVLHVTAADDDTEAIALLLVRGVDPNATGARNCSTPLHAAAVNGH